MKHLFYITLILLISNVSYSQKRDIMSEAPTRPSCNYNSVDWKSEIQLKDSKIVHFRFKNRVSDNVYLRESKSKNNILKECTSKNNELMFHISDIKKSYELVTIDDCRNEVILSIIDDSGRANYNPKTMNVSYLLSKVLKDFSFGEQKLCDILKKDKSTPLAEKISFYQKYKMKGASYDQRFNGSCDDVIEALVNSGFPGCGDDDGPGDGGGDDPEEYECNCTILRITPNHQRNGDVQDISDFEAIVESEDFPGVDQGVKTELSNEGETWEYYSAKGASTWHGLYTEGWKEQHGSMDSVIRRDGDFDDINTSPLRGTIRLHLICMDGNELPSDCECDKPVTVNFTYESYIDAKAIIHQQWFGASKAKSCVEDIGIAYCYQADNKDDDGDLDNYVTVAAMHQSACASCEETVNPEFYSNILNLGDDIIDVLTTEAGLLFTWEYEYHYDSTIIRIDTLQNPPLILDTIYRVDKTVIDSTRNFDISAQSQAYKDLQANVLDVLTTNYYLPKDCGTLAEHNLMENAYTTTLRPNRPLTLGVMGKHILMAGGQRGWYSHAAVASNFDISVVVKPGDFLGPESGCCTPWIAGYILGTSLPGDRELYRSNVGSDIHGYGPFNYGTPNGLAGSGFGGWQVRGDMGYMTQALIGDHDCIPVSTLSKLDDQEMMASEIGLSRAVIQSEKLVERNAKIIIYDISGRKIVDSKINSDTYGSNSSLNHFLSNKLINHKIGMYIVNINDGVTDISFKHINRL